MDFGAYSGVECGYSWDRWSDGSQRGPYMFTVYKYFGSTQSPGILAACQKGGYYKWFVRRKTGVANSWEVGFNSTVKHTWENLPYTLGTSAHIGVEHQLDDTGFVSDFENMWFRKYGDTGWYRWLAPYFYLENDACHGVMSENLKDPSQWRIHWWTFPK